MMIQTISNQTPLIIAEENAAMLNSVVNMLRQKGFVVIRQEPKPAFGQHGSEIKRLDGLNLLRFVTQFWPKHTPVVILQNQLESIATVAYHAAA